jgi:hypothetical protein
LPLTGGQIQNRLSVGLYAGQFQDLVFAAVFGIVVKTDRMKCRHGNRLCRLAWQTIEESDEDKANDRRLLKYSTHIGFPVVRVQPLDSRPVRLIAADRDVKIVI